MNRYTLRAAALVAALALAGCGRGQVRGVPEDKLTRLPETNIDVSAWLKLPRAELAKLADEADALIDKQREGFRNQSADDLLLPRLVAPRTVPVFRKAKYSASLGVSLPDYVKEGRPDLAVAVHLARFGDHEAALKLAGGDRDARAAIAERKAARNYPVEWTRLVALTLIAAQNKLAVGDVAGAGEIYHLHRQLGKVLDEKAAAGPLGAALLGSGRRALAQAGKAFREPRHNKTALADDLDKAVAGWGKVPAAPSALGASKAQAVALFGTAARGQAVVSGDLDRARDLLALPVPTEAAQAVIAYLDDRDRVGEIAIAYRGKLETIYPDADHLGYHLDESGIEGKEEEKTSGVRRTAYAADPERYEITRSNRAAGLGALVRVNAGKSPAARNLRDLGPVSFDRGFEANRVAWVLSRGGPTATVEDSNALKALVAASPVPVPSRAVFQRDPAEDIVQGLRLSWPAEANSEAASTLVPALAHFGPAEVDAGEDDSGSFLRLRWQDGKTKAELRLPYGEQGPTLAIEDAQPASAKAARVKRARQRDEQERAARASQGKRSLRLARSPGPVNDFSLAYLKLGQSRAQAKAALPRGSAYRLKSVSEGLSVVVLSKPLGTVPYWPSQVLVRFDETDRVSEIRVRFREGLAATRKGETLLERLSEGRAGAPEELLSPWEGLWTDQPARVPKPALFRWRDDETVRTYQRDAGGTEVTWHDRDKTPGPWQFLRAGPKGIALGDAREDVERRFEPAGQSSGATLYRAAAKEPYELFMVWYSKDRVERIVAVDRTRAGTQAGAASKALQQVWGRDVDELGGVRRQEGARGAVVASYFWHDDVTRVQASVQAGEKSARVTTEWRSWPIAAATTATE